MCGKKKVIVYATGGWLKSRITLIRQFYEIIAITDKDDSRKSVAEKLNEKFIKVKEIQDYKYDGIFIASTFDKEIKKYLIEEINVDENKIILGDEKFNEFCRELKINFGEKNQDKIFYVLRRSSYRVGLFANILFFLEYLMLVDRRKYTPVIDMKNYANIYLNDTKIGKENSWEYYFKQVSNFDLEEVYKSKNVILGEADILESHDNEYLFEGIVKNDSIRKKYQQMYKKYIHLNDQMKNEIEKEYDKLLKPIKDNKKKICGVIYRGTDYLKLKPYNHHIQPELDTVIKKTKEMMEEWKFDYIYFDTEDEAAIEKFKNEFGEKVIYSEKARIKEYPNELINVTFNRDNDEFLKGKEYLITRYLLSRCDYFISGENCGSRGVLIINMDQFEEKFIFDFGKYGFEDDSYSGTPDGEPIILKNKKIKM